MQVVDKSRVLSSQAVRTILSDEAPRATSFIVTIYGDVVEPRGGTLWMGTLIDCCARHGISESLVRTAVSRLVGAGRLVGERVGRKSYYRLSNAGQAEFREAARILYSPPPPAEEWLICMADDEPDILCPEGWVRIGSSMMIAPNHAGIRMPEGVAWVSRVIAGQEKLPDLALRFWPLEAVAKAYNSFVSHFGPVADEVEKHVLSDADALALRLRLVDEYRRAALPDPRLPRQALPADWPDMRGRQIFRRVYLAVSDAAERYVGRSFFGSHDLLPETTAATTLRRQALLQVD